jgi:hypothetical protein
VCERLANTRGPATWGILISTVTKSPPLRPLTRLSRLSVDPTLTTDEMQAGDARASAAPSLPEATTVAIPTDRRLWMIGL